MEKTWRCSVCGYLHKGENPPDFCPVCLADASKFELVSESPAPEPAAKVSRQSGLLREMLEVFEPHAVAAHFPNALMPTTVLFLFLFLVVGRPSFETTSFYLLVVSVVSVPPTFATGIVDWKKRYGGQSASIFRKKISLALILFCLGIITTLWRWKNPQLLSHGGWPAGLFMLLLLAMLGCVTLLGHYGGTLVFARQRQSDQSNG